MKRRISALLCLLAALLFCGAAAQPEPTEALPALEGYFFQAGKADAILLTTDQELAKAVARLPQKQRQVFVMRWWDELTYEEISAITGTSVGALKASYHLARQKIQESVSAEILPEDN